MYEAIPMCRTCGEREVVGEYSDNSGNGFCSYECHLEMRDDFDTYGRVETYGYNQPMDIDEPPDW